MRKVPRSIFLLMAMFVVLSPVATAQSTPQAAPVETEAPVDAEVPVGPDVVETEVSADPDAPGIDGEDGPVAPEDADGTPEAGEMPGQPEEATQTRQQAMDVVVQQASDGTLVVDVVGSDPDRPVPAGALVCVSVVWNCVPWLGEPVTFTVPEGEYLVSFDMFDESYYTDASAMVSVTAGETVDVTLTLEPRQPGTLRLYIATDTGAPVPAGTMACVQQDATDYTDAVDSCLPAESGMVDFAVNEGWVDVTVVTPEDSGFGGASNTVWVPGGTMHRAYLVLQDDFDAVVTIDVATEDGWILGAHPSVCLKHVNTSLGQCEWVSIPTYDDDGGYNYEFHVPEGDWTWVVSPSMEDAARYLPVSGTVSVANGDEVTVEATLSLRTEADAALVTVDVITFDGSAVPDGTVVCVRDDLMAEPECRDWDGDLQDYTVAAGSLIVEVHTPEDSGYSGYFTVMPLVLTGDEYVVRAILYPLDLPLVMEVEVSDAEPEAGDLVTYWLTARGPGFEFLIEDVLPAGLTDVTIMCAGEFTSLIPTGCAEYIDGTLIVPGFTLNGEFIDVTVQVMGTIVGEPGTEVTNEACVTTFLWTGDETACDSVGLRIADVVEPEPSVTPDPDDTPVVTPDPVETPAATATPDPAGAAATPEDSPEVTKLPSTGGGSGDTPSIATYAILTAGALLFSAGILRLLGARR